MCKLYIKNMVCPHCKRQWRSCLTDCRSGTGLWTWELGFSSPAHFSTQFKKESGLSPMQFKALKEKNRIPIDRI